MAPGVLREIRLPCHGIVVRIDTNGCGSVESQLEQADTESLDDAELAGFKGCMAGIESLILACACAGVDIETPAFIEAVESAAEAGANFYG